MAILCDLHLHSKYSRATSRDMDVESLSLWARRKGIQVVGTGDFTHPLWLRELRSKLRPAEDGLFEYQGTRFVLTVEVSSVYPQDGKLRKVHTLLLSPSFEVCDRINAVLGRFGNLAADGRPTLTLSCAKLVEYVMEISPRCLVIPAHAWTPWFSVFGSQSGFDSLEECFRDQLRHVRAIETGLSSDPPMNWRISRLDGITLVSFSDAHSPNKLGREATALEAELSYDGIVEAIRAGRVTYTIEFFPEEGKYHYDGHRACGVRLHPRETRALGGRCPKCGRPVTVGVLHRVESLADRPEETVPPGRPPYRNLIPLEEILAEALEQGVGTVRVREEYLKLVERFGGEFAVLMDVPLEELRKVTPPRVVEGILRMRTGQVHIEPGYDGEFGRIHLFAEGEDASEGGRPAQMSLF
ncbi:MAG: endonuclease Q family protein [Armatimonadota bacterium]|nr:endonuclease Q family protein [Armatimonadota bacterium]MDR7439278.1 endonuclease Q family protein [Armatimonadota bacterium]MDR7562055.1 endonuclease Q family protein [Armatimonadota bacterium]MDR7567275.1 endonuclease Q family protein [Armatimonadota bacterium]MDR7601118.1 endonuclease Q family protein [Armatimonadota bacterium]